MAHFIGYLQGNRGDVSRLGSKASGIRASAQGWNIGATITVHEHNGKDYVAVSLHHGSNGGGKDLFLGTFTLSKKGTIKKLRNGQT